MTKEQALSALTEAVVAQRAAQAEFDRQQQIIDDAMVARTAASDALFAANAQVNTAYNALIQVIA